MKKIMTFFALICVGAFALACGNGNKEKSDAKASEIVMNAKDNNKASADANNDANAKSGGEVIVMNKAMFIKEIFDYENTAEWKYKGNKPAIIDLYADWCGPCRMTAPIMKELAKKYTDKIVIYKVNVDKERELAALFNATSIPLFVFIPMNGEPQLFKGAADKATYTKVIEEFLLKKE